MRRNISYCMITEDNVFPVDLGGLWMIAITIHFKMALFTATCVLFWVWLSTLTDPLPHPNSRGHPYDSEKPQYHIDGQSICGVTWGSCSERGLGLE